MVDFDSLANLTPAPQHALVPGCWAFFNPWSFKMSKRSRLSGMVIKRGGTSMQKVLAYVQERGKPVTSLEVRLALYDKVSSCSEAVNLLGSETPKEKLVMRWASRILAVLTKRGLLVADKSEWPVTWKAVAPWKS